MVQSPTLSQYPPYVPATQITPDSINEIPTQQPDFLTQEDQRLLFQDENSDDLSINTKESSPKEGNHTCIINGTRRPSQQDFGTKLFTGNKVDYSARTHTSRNYYDKLFSSDSEDSSSLTSDCRASHDLLEQMPPNQIDLEDLSRLPTEIKDELLGFNQPIPKMMVQEVSPDFHTDKIATYNVQNKYDHVSAAELMIKENITYIAFQEPFFSTNQPAESWQSFSKSELQSSRIDCYQTHHQIILVDTFRWGGKILTNFASHFNGRFTEIAFHFGNGNKLGIISIYASSAEIHDNDTQGTNKKILQKIIQKRAKWEKEFPNIDIVILGDFQETSTTSDRDNVGHFRKHKLEEGILMELEDNFESYVRKLQKTQPYVTRFGNAGGRGIDHIMVPTCDAKHNSFPNAYICRDQGATYFPSDHSLLVCEYNRNDRNNNEDSVETIKYKYSSLYNIKMKNTGVLGKNISLNESQFKESEKFREQAALYNRVQQITGDTADMSNYHLDPLEARLEALTSNLWETGQEQHICGSENKLVKINEDQAIEIAYIYKKFMVGVQDIMGALKLTEERNTLAAAGKSRGRLRRGRGFKMFHNLPIPSKIRYLRNALKGKRRLLEKAQNWLKELYVRQAFDGETMNNKEFWDIRDCIVRTSTIEKQAESIASKMSGEDAERAQHIEHIRYMKNSSKTQSGNSKNHENKSNSEYKANHLPFISDSMTGLINQWLKEAGCDHIFNTTNAASIGLDVLTKDISKWKVPLTDFWEEESITDNMDLRYRLHESLETCLLELRKIENKLNLIQINYRKSTLRYFLKVNIIDSFTRKVLHKQRSAPTTHSMIWDDSLQSSRPCVNEVEELRATQEHHGKWMGNTKAPENCAFAEIIQEGKLGPRGIKLKSTRKLKMEDIPKLIHNGKKLSRKVKRAFLSAHNKYISKLFRCPKHNRREFFYPFYLLDKTGTMNDEKLVERKLWRSLGSIPGKARHDGFQLATIGRFGKRWRQLLCKLIKTMLVMRYIPYEMKKIARYPIPKPGKLNEYRPISLCNDLYCFLNSIITSKTSRAIEKTKLLHSGIASYQKGKSCATLVTIEQSFREDCIESNLPSVQLDEDEEKFFDRVCLEIILASMRINGFPDHGFVEFKACMMSEKIVEIITCKGTVFAKFVCGLEQGNPDSPTIANLVIKMKHDVWAMLPQSLRDIIRNDPEGKCNRYKFHVQDKDDGEVWIYMMGYCDDNTKFISTHNEELLIELAQHYVQTAGDLSMITKIGRKSSKCEIQFFNISAKMTMKLQKIWSTAWSFIHDAPVEEQVPFKVYLQEEELIKFYDLCNYDELSTEEKEKWDKIVHSKAHRHLGLTSTLGGDTSATSQATIGKMYDRLTKLKVRHMEHAAQVKCINMLIATMHSYVPLQSNYDQDELNRLDASIINMVGKRNGISYSDCKHRLFLPTFAGGLGFASTLDTDIIATARELEIVSNGQGLDSEVFRTRIASIPEYLHIDEANIINHARKAILKLAKYGIYFRDKRDGIINDILDLIADDNNIYSISNHLYKDGNAYSIGFGKERNIKCAFGSHLHLLLRHLQHNNWVADGSESKFKIKLPCSIDSILKIKKVAQSRMFREIISFHSYFEWINPLMNNIASKVDSNPNTWNRIDITNEVKTKFPNMGETEWDNQDMLSKEIESINRIKWRKHVIGYSTTSNAIEFETYSPLGRVLNFIEGRGSPIIVATDGAHLLKDNNQTASSFVICSLDIRHSETLLSGEWINRPMIPLLARTAAIPSKVGAHKADIAHGEGYAFVLQELALDPSIPRIAITDSIAIRSQVLNVRNDDSKEIDRDYIRNKAGGISKYLVGIVKKHMDELSQKRKEAPFNNDVRDIWIQKLTNRNIEFLQMAKEWTTEAETTSTADEPENSIDRRWNYSYWDNNTSRAVLKVDSHQLDKHGRTIKKSPRYASLVPNLALLSANHHADAGAEMGLTLHSTHGSCKQAPTESTFHKPGSNLNFYFAADGQLIDRHISNFLRDRFNTERIQRLRKKPTQGFLWRIFDQVTITWTILNLHKGFLRSLLGMSNSHSRNIYKSSIYREGTLLNFLEKINDEETKKCIMATTVNEQIKYLLPCQWCQCHSGNSQKGNRRHLLLHCNNDRLSKFRKRINNIVGSRMANFFEELEKKTSTHKNTELICEIEAQFLKLQSEQTGRLK